MSITADWIFPPSTGNLSIFIGAGEGARRGHLPNPPPHPHPQKWEKYFSDKYHVKFGHMINFSYIYFRAKILPQVD